MPYLSRLLLAATIAIPYGTASLATESMAESLPTVPAPNETAAPAIAASTPTKAPLTAAPSTIAPTVTSATLATSPEPATNAVAEPDLSLQQAENLDLTQPIDESDISRSKAATTAPLPPAAAADSEQSRSAVNADSAVEADVSEPTPTKLVETPPPPEPLVLLGAKVPAGTSTRLAWAPSQSFDGIYSPTPVLVVNGQHSGPTLCLTAAVHGDELNGIETVRRVLYNLDPTALSGAVVGVPIVNLQGFHRGSRYLSDRRDLNRFFPGDPSGSSASRIAHSFFHELISHCSAVVDLHTGSFYRTNLPQLRADLGDPKVVKLTKSFGSTVVLHSAGAVGTLRQAAVAAGIPTVTLEAGAPMVLDETSVSHSVKGIQTLLNQLGMVKKFSLWGDPEPVYYNSIWQRADKGGIIFSNVKLGAKVRSDELLGTVTNPVTNVRTEIRSKYNGRILGMALNQVVQPGFAAYHIGIEAPEEQVSPPQDVTTDNATIDTATDETGNADVSEANVNSNTAQTTANTEAAKAASEKLPEQQPGAEAASDESREYD